MNTHDYIRSAGVSFTYPDGEFSLNVGNVGLSLIDITFITGKNGSGKSTLGKLLAGIIKPDKGNVYICGYDTKTLTLGQIGKMVGYLWQKCELQLFADTVREELLFVDRIKNPMQSVEYAAATEANAMEWLRYFSIDQYADRSSFFLSKGEKQRLALAAVVSIGARYLILDEPTTGLDAKNKNTLSSLLIKLNNENNIGMAIISHDKEFINSLSTRVITLSGGEIICDKKTLN